MKRLIALFGLLALLLLESSGAPASAGTTVAVFDRHMATAAHVTALAASAPATVTVHAGDTYGKWALRYCGRFDAWHALQAANGWPERRIPVGATARIACYGYTPETPAPPATPAATGPWVHPLASGKHGNSCYGWRASTSSFHGGVDMAQPSGTPIRAVTSGNVYSKGYEAHGAGYWVLLKHPGGIYTMYDHMPNSSPLGIGTAVTVGQQIGRVGATGNATGPHLHFEVRVGGASSRYRTNPATFMRNHGVNIGC